MKKLTKGKVILFSGTLLLISIILHELIGYKLITIIIMLISTIISGTPIFKKAINALKYKIVGIDALVTIAVIGAIVIGEYYEAAAVTFLFVLGDYLEARTIEKTRSSIKSLLSLAPSIARVRRDGKDIEVAVDEVVKDDVVIVKPGEKIAVDGVVLSGSAYVNQSSITGESLPVSRAIDESVFAGTIIESGYLVIKAMKVGDDTSFARILEMVEEAQDKKAKTQKFLEKFSRYYTPIIIVLAILMYIITRDLVLSLTLLVIACPGALVISAPVSIVAGIGNGAKQGVLVKGGEIMEKLGKVKVIAFDKTGTLTIGKPTVTNIKTYDIDENELLKLASIGESYSEHPLAKAIISKAEEKIGKIDDVASNIEIITGLGLKFEYNNETYLIGNRKLFTNNNASTTELEEYLVEEESKGQTAVIIGSLNRIYGVISISDIVKDDAKSLIVKLKELGIKKVIMLTGDNHRAANYIATKTGLDEYYAELLPEDKVRILKELQAKYGYIAMVGDGVNDAPALAYSDLGIAIGGVGSDVAMETADIVLMSSSLSKLAYAVGLSRATVKNMKQNIYFAILVAITLLLGVLIKRVNLSFGMLIHEASVLLVVINAARLLYYKKYSKIK